MILKIVGNQSPCDDCRIIELFAVSLHSAYDMGVTRTHVLYAAHLPYFELHDVRSREQDD